MDGIEVHVSSLGLVGLAGMRVRTTMQTKLIGSRDEREVQQRRAEFARRKLESLGLLMCISKLTVTGGNGKLTAGGTVVVHEDSDEGLVHETLDELERELRFFAREYPLSSVILAHEQRGVFTKETVDAAAARDAVAGEEA